MPHGAMDGVDAVDDKVAVVDLDVVTGTKK